MAENANKKLEAATPTTVTTSKYTETINGVQYEVTREESTVFKDIRLELDTTGEFLCATEVKRLNDVYRKINPKTGKPQKLEFKRNPSKTEEALRWELIEVSTEDIRKFRQKKVPLFILKRPHKFLLTEIPESFSLMATNLFGRHICGIPCNHLSPAPDEFGGCAKVRDRLSDKKIENYPWIGLGYETTGTQQDVFEVVRCAHFIACPPRPKKSCKEIAAIKRELAQFL